ncbi:L-threonylcarbamoyladenylate synthase [Homoserinibacter sp. YIM 151385]|uniref:L-threonylcarbamoyladenylate synthase n=1 Tax=Homoserinibacter sp. YIM 151385 TaxID=2985506 RepID=UPI0022F04A83|nr:L-threonylcarbamoyladenylate synthase [Homoserinibacter sp. YIM 151385]WBU38283.1 L-threonylcarbamoyladenylate synthase [Homoserinibacter sp. YIM 151385]
MAPLFDSSDPAALLSGMRLARQAIARGELAVIPTDTVYGVAADAFQPEAVQRLLDAKGRDRTAPPPVLVPGVEQLGALADPVPTEVHALVEEFWPGGLTIILRSRPMLDWDLGETRGTVALRMPDEPLALELLADTGPLAVSSANRTGEPAALTAAEAEAMLGDSVAVYLEAGLIGDADHELARAGSTIVDATALEYPAGKLRILRHGVIADEDIIRVVGADRCA